MRKKIGWFVALAVVGASAMPVFAVGDAGAGLSMISPLAVGAGAHLPTWVFQIFDYLVLSLLALASIAGIALAIDAMLNIREKKIAPAETTEHLRTLIASREYKEL